VKERSDVRWEKRLSGRTKWVVDEGYQGGRVERSDRCAGDERMGEGEGGCGWIMDGRKKKKKKKKRKQKQQKAGFGVFVVCVVCYGVWCSDCRANRRAIARANRAVKGGG